MSLQEPAPSGAFGFKLILKTRKLMIRCEGCGLLCCLAICMETRQASSPLPSERPPNGSSPRTDVLSQSLEGKQLLSTMHVTHRTRAAPALF